MRINQKSMFNKPPNPYLYGGTVAVVALVLIMLADYPFIGQVGIGLYALLAYWRLDSGQVFRLAMVSLAVMLGALVMGQGQVADSFSAYAFLLFMVGVFVLVRELWHYSQALRSERKEDNAR